MQLPVRKRADDAAGECSAPAASGRHRGRIDGVKVFSAYRHEERNQLGRAIGQWLEDNDDVEVVETIVTQSSGGSGFHCLTITLLCSVLSVAPSVPGPVAPDRDSSRVVDLLAATSRDLGAVLSRVSSSSAAREVVGEMNVERLQDAVTSLGAALEDLARA